LAYFENYSWRAKVIVFFALHNARAEGSGYIDPEHILHALVHEDPELFQLVAPETPDLAKQLEKEVCPEKTLPTEERATKELPLSEASKEIVHEAAAIRSRFGHQQVTTQHLLLAILASKGPLKLLFRGRAAHSKAQELLLQHGITAESVEAKTKGGQITPSNFDWRDPIMRLNAQLSALADLLIEKRIFTRLEFVALIDQHEGPISCGTYLSPLIEALWKKGAITSSEKDDPKIAGTQQSSAS
jgi:ATP-dependent Clp protease ATP-binding subunit ClpA